MSNRWQPGPVVALRQSGFPFDLLEPLAFPAAVAAARRVALREAAARSAASELRQALRFSTRDPGPVASRLGMLADLGDLAPQRAGDYQRALAELRTAHRALERAHAEGMAHGRRAVTEMFKRDPALQEVLLLSNDAHYPRFADWLRAATSRFTDRRARRMADLLTMYLQRVTAKNETAAHFGPVNAGQFRDHPPGITWTPLSKLARRGFFTHWAAEILAETFARRPGLRDSVRPRRRPLALLAGDRTTVYAPASRTSHIGDWRFEQLGTAVLDDAGRWLLTQADGASTVVELRAAWPDRWPRERFEAVLAEFADRDWLVNRYEIPVGSAWPLRELRAALPPADRNEDARWAHEVLTALEERLDAIAGAPVGQRAGALQQLKETFSIATGSVANRGGGRHYADRSLYFEECHGRVGDLTLGPDLHQLVADDLSVGYDLGLAGPRLRIRREASVLARWLSDRFGNGVRVPLNQFYAGYLQDRSTLDAECAIVEKEMRNLDDNLTSTLLDGAAPDTAEVVVPRQILVEWVSRHGGSEPAVCNPDIMLAAPDPEAIAEGRFLAVLAECHAVRELLTHTSFSPLLHETDRDLATATYHAYQSLLAEDEVLCDVVRAHPNKTGSQLRFPCFDLEITGRSTKERRQVIAPSSLYVIAQGDTIALHARGVNGRLRLLTAPAGGPGIRQDPLTPFAFPRSHGGMVIRGPHLTQVPRIRTGRVVLARRTWRVAAAELRGRGSAGASSPREVAEFYDIQVMRERLALPRRLFAKISTEPKPIFVDLDSPALVRQLCRLARKAERVEFSEMLPGPEGLWLCLDGRRYTAELRCAVFSTGGRHAPFSNPTTLEEDDGRVPCRSDS